MVVLRAAVSGLLLGLLALPVLPAAAAVEEGPLWVAIEAGPNDFDVAGAGAVDPTSGAVYVTGSVDEPDRSGSYGALVAYDEDGSVRWRRPGPGPGLDVTVDPDNGTVFQLADAYGVVEAAVRCYSPRGQLLRSSTYSAAGGFFEPSQLAFDAVRDQVYVIGTTQVGGSLPAPFVYTTVAFGGSGAVLWARDFQGEAEANFARDLAVDPASGTVYVTGYGDELLGGTTTTVAYSAAGDELWAVREPSSVLDSVDAIGVDPASGNVYLTGSRGELVVAGGDFLVTIAYRSDGSRRWIRREAEPTDSLSRSALAVDPATGGVVVASARYTFPDLDQAEQRVRSYAPVGRLNWRQTLTGPQAGDQGGIEVALGPGAQVHTGALGDGQILLNTLSGTGQPLRATSYPAVGFVDLAVSPVDGTTIVVGQTFEPDGTSNWLTLAYASA